MNFPVTFPITISQQSNRLLSSRVAGFDWSNWQKLGFAKNLDFAAMHQNGFQFAVGKASMGGGPDPAFLDYSALAVNAGYDNGGYHWEDPTQPVISQANYFLKQLETSKAKFAWVDFEQYFKWGTDGNPDYKSVIDPSQIDGHMHQLVRYLEARLGVPWTVYTGIYMINDYSPNTWGWCTNVQPALAEYLDSGNGGQSVTWDQVNALLTQNDHPHLGKFQNWTFWQCYRWVLPCHRTNSDKLDIDIFNGDMATWNTYLATGTMPITIAIPPIVVHAGKIINCYVLGVSSAPGKSWITNPSGVFLKVGDSVNVYAIDPTTGWLKIDHDKSWWVNPKFVS